MKKIFLMIFVIIFVFFVASCGDSSKKQGVIPTKEFIVDKNIDNNAVYQRKTNLTVSGNGETGVNLIVELINKNNRVIESSNVKIDKNNKWKVSLETPNGSFDSYKIRIYDEYNKFEKIFTNIRFGEVIMVMGDSLPNDELLVDEEINLSFMSCYYFTNNDGNWLDLSKDYNLITEYLYQVATTSYENLNLPVCLIVNQTNAKLYEWLSIKNIDQVSPIKQYLTENELYNNNPTSFGDMGYLELMRSEFLKNMHISKILWYHGDNELDLFNDDKYVNIYFQMLMTLMDSLVNSYRNVNIALVETMNIDKDNVIKLRRVEEYVGNYYTNVKIIPTFDINGENNIENIVKRTYNILNNNKLVSQYGNLITDIDSNTELITKIKIEINNTDNIILKNNTKEDDTINYFNIFYDDPELGRILLDIDPIIENNFIIIDLTYEEEIINDNDEIENVLKVYDKNLVCIEYGMSANLKDVNIFNEYKIPILPFIIIFD